MSDETSYSGNLAGVNALLNSPMVSEMLLKKATEVMERAKDIAPVGDPATDPHSGRYRNGFRVEVRYNALRRRPEAVVINDSPEALMVEKGTSNNEPFNVLARALDVLRGV
jgi:hypothetical protein